MFYVGQKVVCVDDSESPNISGSWSDRVYKGEIYTVSAVGLTHWLDPQKLPCIHVAEVNRVQECPFWAHRFRPLVEDKKKVATFIPVPIPKRVKKLEDA